MEMYKADKSAASKWEGWLFMDRINQGTATTGVHNYAIDQNTMQIERSGLSGHAEILLLALSNAQTGEEALIVSEYKPCPSCQGVIQKIEQTKKINVRVLYLLDYHAKGDGDVTVTREYYKALGFLKGGGDYVYQVNYDNKTIKALGMPIQ